jgi:hypothetical protein
MRVIYLGKDPKKDDLVVLLKDIFHSEDVDFFFFQDKKKFLASVGTCSPNVLIVGKNVPIEDTHFLVDWMQKWPFPMNPYVLKIGKGPIRFSRKSKKRIKSIFGFGYISEYITNLEDWKPDLKVLRNTE